MAAVLWPAGKTSGSSCLTGNVTAGNKQKDSSLTR